MKVAFPIKADLGLDSVVHDHFGSASGFIVVDVDQDVCVTVANQKREHIHGQCQPVAALGGHPVDAVAVVGIGGGAIRKLNRARIKVLRAVAGTVRANLEKIKQSQLPELTIDQACTVRHGEGECGH